LPGGWEEDRKKREEEGKTRDDEGRRKKGMVDDSGSDMGIGSVHRCNVCKDGRYGMNS
jgi:hypothetical protein